MKKKRLNNIIDIGSLDRIISIESVTKTRDDFGAEIETYSGVNHWAKVNWLRDKEDESGGDVRANYRIEVIIRYTSGITTNDRVLYEGRMYDIENYRELGRRRFIVLNCLSYG